jgi:cellobiose phosphorylase
MLLFSGTVEQDKSVLLNRFLVKKSAWMKLLLRLRLQTFATVCTEKVDNVRLQPWQKSVLKIKKNL